MKRIPPLLFVLLFVLAAARSSAEFRLGEMANQVAEVSLFSGTNYPNPFLDVQLDALVTQPEGTQLQVLGFWAGGGAWHFRCASDKVGTHTWRTECTDTANPGLHGVTGSRQVVASTSANPLFLHDPICATSNHRHSEHADGTPFLWLGDTCWKNLCKQMNNMQSKANIL